MSSKIKVIFILGVLGEDENDTTKSFLTNELRKEKRVHGDILQTNITDSYMNISLKYVSFLEYALMECSSVPFIFKGDDDILLNLRLFYGKLDYFSNLEKQLGLYMLGANITGAGPVRKTHTYIKYSTEAIHKWTVPEDIYPCKYWGFDYMAGAFFNSLSDVTYHVL